MNTNAAALRGGRGTFSNIAARATIDTHTQSHAHSRGRPETLGKELRIMRRVQCEDRARSATFIVERYVLRSVVLSASLPGESQVIEGMIGTPIDPDVLAEAPTVDEAISAIAVNTSNIACAALSHIYTSAVGTEAPQMASSSLIPVKRAPIQDLPSTCFSGGPIALGDEPVTLESLPATLILHIYCALGALDTAYALSGSCRALRALLYADGLLHPSEATVALPVWDRVRPLMPGTVELTADGTLHRTARPGFGLVHISGALRRLSALVELRLNASGAHSIAFGVAAIRNSSEAASTLMDDQLWFEGSGKLVIGSALSDAPKGKPRAYGDRLRAHDVVGILYDGRASRVAFTRRSNGSLCLTGPWVSLPPVDMRTVRSQHVAHRPPLGYRFCIRFDGQPCTSLVIDTSFRAPVDLAALSRRPPSPPRALPVDAHGVHEPALLLRTIGPDSSYIPVDLDPEIATVGELRGEAAAALEVERHQVALRLVLHSDAGPSMEHQLTDDAAKLEDCGVRLESNGVLLGTLYCSVPHLIS